MLTIGKIAKPQGLKGEMKVLPFGDDELFMAPTVFVGGVAFDVESVSKRPNGLFLKLTGVDDIARSSELKNKLVEIPLDVARSLLGKDKFLWQDAIGASVVADNKTLGKIVDIDNFGSADVVFATKENGEQFSFPIVKGLLKDLSEGQMVVDEKRFNEVVCDED